MGLKQSKPCATENMKQRKELDIEENKNRYVVIQYFKRCYWKSRKIRGNKKR